MQVSPRQAAFNRPVPTSIRPATRPFRWIWLPPALLAAGLLFVLTACGGGGVTGALTGGGPGKLLAWIGSGPSPKDKDPGTTGQVVYFDPGGADGALETLLEVPAAATGVIPCGENATSPDGRYFALLVNIYEGGRDGGTVYQVTGAGQPVALGPAHALSCAGMGTLQYSPNSSRVAYIDYDEPTGDYAAGTLRIFDTAAADELLSVANVGAFHIGDDGGELLQYYTGDQNRLDEIAVLTWTQANAPQEIATLFADPNCVYTGTTITPAAGKIAMLVGQRCTSGTRWQFYTVNRDGGELTLVASDAQSGGYFSNTRTAALLTGSSDQQVLWTTADGIARNTVGVLAGQMNTLTPDTLTTVIRRGAVMPRYAARELPLPDNAAPVFSLDRRWWALVNIDGAAKVQVINLTAVDQPPVVAEATQGQSIPVLLFAPDGSAIYYVAGGVEGRDNTLAKLTLPGGEVTRLSDGKFGPGAIARDGTLALTVWQPGTDPRETLYQTLALINPADGSSSRTLFTGISYADSGAVSDQQFVYPLTFRR